MWETREQLIDHAQVVLTLLGAVAAAAAVYFAVVLIIRACDKKRAERKAYPRLIWLGVTLICVAVTVVSYISNIGWIRVILIWAIIPMLQPIFLTVASVVTAPWIKHSKKLAAIAVINHICFVGSNLMLPDTGDIGPSYVFFGLINEYPGWLIPLAFVPAAASIGLTIAQLVVSGEVKAKLVPPAPVYYIPAQHSELIRQVPNDENNQYLT